MNPKSWLRTLVMVVSAALVVPASWSQAPGKTGPNYDAANELTVTGTVAEIRQTPGEWEGIHLVVKSGERTVIVHLAPAEFLRAIDCWIKVGDQVEVVGAKAPNTTENEILAREVTFGNNKMVLRDNKGVPVWAGWSPTGEMGK